MIQRRLVAVLRNRSDGRNRSGGDGRRVSRKRDFGGGSLGVGVLLGAIPRDMAGLATLVAGLASSVQRATVGGGAVARDVTKLAACVALHRLRLTVTSEVIRAAALVAGGRSRAARKAAAALGESASVAATGNRSASAHVHASRVRAGALGYELATSVPQSPCCHGRAIDSSLTAKWPGCPQL